MRKTCDLYGQPRTDASELQNVQQDEYDASSEAEDVSASNVAADILNSSSLQATGELPIKNMQLQGKKYLKKKITFVVKKILRVSK